MPRERFLAMGWSLHGAKRSVARAGAAASMLVGALVWGALDGHGQVLPLTFARAPSVVRVTPDGRDLVVEFVGPLPDGEADRAAKALGTLLEGYAEGYGAIRFRLTTPMRAALAGSGSKIVEITPGPALAATPADERHLALLQARTQAQAGDLAGAEVRLRQISAEAPADIEPVLALAETENDAGHWERALGLYDGVLRLFPAASDVTRERDDLSGSHAASIRPELGATFGPNGERAQTVTLTGDLPLGEQWRGTVALQTTHDSVRGLRQAFSSTTANYSAIKELGSVSLARRWDAGVGTTRVGLFAAPSTAGADVSHSVTTQFGDTTLTALYHQPYWGTVMAFAANARRDQVAAAQLVKLPAQWQLQAGVGVIRYGIPGHDTVASGPSALAGLSKGLPPDWLPWDGMALRLGYRLEAEYLSRTQTAPSAIGPLPLLDVRAREVHSLYAEGTAPVGPGTLTALLGYALDRYGGGGPQALLRYTSGSDSDRLIFSAEAGVEPSLDINPRTLFHIGAYSIWRFGGS